METQHNNDLYEHYTSIMAHDYSTFDNKALSRLCITVIDLKWL